MSRAEADAITTGADGVQGATDADGVQGAEGTQGATDATEGAVDPAKAPAATPSTAELSLPPARRGAIGRLLRSELRLVFGRKRNIVGLVGLCLVPVLLGTVIAITRDTTIDAEGPPFLDRVTGNGLFLVLATMVVCLPLLLPLAVSIVAGDSVAGEAQSGTLRYLLTVPVRRTRLLAVKAVAVVAFIAATVLAVALSGVITGAAYFGLGEVTLISGDTVSTGEGLLRVLGVVGYVVLSLTGLIAVGVFISTMTEVPIAAMAATVVAAVLSTVLDSIPQLHSIQPYLLTHHWLDFGEFLRAPIDYATLGSGMTVQAAWVVVFGALAWSRFTTKDVSS